MFRVWDISLMICFSVSLMFVEAEHISELPPPRNLTFKWETPFTLNLTWEKPKDLGANCEVNYTVEVHNSQNCTTKEDISQSRRVQKTMCILNISNENGLCISVIVNPENCGNKKHSRSLDISIPQPAVTLVKNRRYEYSHNRLNCTWTPDTIVQDLGFYYWTPHKDKLIKCTKMKIGECIIHDTSLNNTTDKMFYLFNGTFNGKPVNNTFMDKRPTQYVKLKKPQLTIQRFGQYLHFSTDNSDLEFARYCYKYNYTYSVCDKNVQENIIKGDQDGGIHKVDYDSNCKYRVRVQVFLDSCCSGKSDLSDEVEYGENRDPNLPALLAVIIIPLIVSCCLIVSLVLLRRHKDIIFPKIPEPSLIFKDMLINNIRIPEDLRQSPSDGRLYVPIEEIVESKISLEPETPLVPTTTNATLKQV